MQLKVGELAKRSGLTIRTLHHYDAIGLLKPSTRSDAGYRLYNDEDITRLHGIQGLRNLGLQLRDIDRMLAVNGATLPEIISRQLLALEQEILQAEDLRGRLILLQERLLVGIKPDVDDWLAALALMTTHGKYFSAKELTFIFENWTQMEAEWQPLINDVCDAAKKNYPVDSPPAQVLARRWMDLAMRWMKNDIDLLHRWRDMCLKEPAAYGQSGIDSASFHYIGRAIKLRVEAFQKYLSADEIKRLNKNLDEKWAELEKAAKEIIQRKLPADSEEAQHLVIKWRQLLDEATDHDPVIREKLMLAVRSEPLIQAGSPLSAEVWNFIRNAYLPCETEF